MPIQKNLIGLDLGASLREALWSPGSRPKWTNDRRSVGVCPVLWIAEGRQWDVPFPSSSIGTSIFTRQRNPREAGVVGRRRLAAGDLTRARCLYWQAGRARQATDRATERLADRQTCRSGRGQRNSRSRAQLAAGRGRLGGRGLWTGRKPQARQKSVGLPSASGFPTKRCYPTLITSPPLAGARITSASPWINK